MKISLKWVFDHIEGDIQSVDIARLIAQFSKTTAEIDSFTQITYDTANWFLMQVQKISSDAITMHNSFLNKTAMLSMRSDIQIHDWAIVKIVQDKATWLTLQDLGSSKEGLLASIHVPIIDTQDKKMQQWISRDWINDLENDYIIEMDNKSITHRPDLWAHRGIAREVAAILGLKLKPLDALCASFINNHYKAQGSVNDLSKVAIAIETPLCKRIAALNVDVSDATKSLLFIAQRLARVDSRALNALVDFTNYVMFDLGQPMHAFDRDKIQGNQLIVRIARNKETIRLLDDTTVSLHAHDIVIADAKRPLALAGIMGGTDASLSSTSRHLLIESANFDATTIRRTALACKKRTESSTRFEKSLDPFANITALQRFVWLLSHYQIPFVSSKTITSMGIEFQPTTLEVTHSFIEQRLGISLDSSFICDTLQALDCQVIMSKKQESVMYQITIPSFRATKDLLMKEDIVEEIGRFFGYDNIDAQLPHIATKPKSLNRVNFVHDIKHYCAYAARMHEVSHYSLYDESWLAELQWQPEAAVHIKNPLSENWQRLVTSLMPHLFKAVYNNRLEKDQLRFFEWARMWHADGEKIREQKSLAGILYQQEAIDFYQCKSFVDQLYASRGCIIEWQQMEKPVAVWYQPYRSARLIYQNTIIGYAGLANPSFAHHLLPENAFIFELQGDFLETYEHPVKRIEALSKYPEVRRDISMIVPTAHTVASIIARIKQADARIVGIHLIDSFTKQDWQDQKSLTFRFVVRDKDKTMTTQEVDAIWNVIADDLKKHGALIR